MIVKHIVVFLLCSYLDKVKIVWHEIFVGEAHAVCVFWDKAFTDEVFSYYTYAYLVETRVTAQSQWIGISWSYQIHVYSQDQINIQLAPLVFPSFGQRLTM